MKKITGVYRIINTVTGDTYIGSSIDIKRRWQHHRCPSIWNAKTNRMYKDMQQYGVDKFRFTMIALVEEKYLKQVEQEAIEMFNPTYNRFCAKIENIETYQQDYYVNNKEHKIAITKQIQSQLCCYKGETLTLGALKERFRRRNVPHPQIEAKKYLLVSH